MNAPVASIDEVFGAGGPLARAMPGFEARPGQVQMARLIERGFLENAHTIVEAGTGVGKSLAYLVPALRSGKKIVISTGTIALQEQLVRKDLPLVTRALGIDARVELLKGRNHYLCKAKYQKQTAERLVAQSVSMQRLWEWADLTETGDRAELPFVPLATEWEQLDADADDCVGEFCAQFRDCFFFERRDAARFADIVVVNHALFFLDLAMGGGLLPPYDYAILDEAHQCERYATAALTATLSQATVGRTMRKLHGQYRIPGAYDAEISEAVRGLMQVLARVPGDRYPLRPDDDIATALDALEAAFMRVENWLYQHALVEMRRTPDSDAEAERRRDLALRSVGAHLGTIERIRRSLGEGDVEREAIAWVERLDGSYGGHSVNAAPFAVAEFLRETLFARTQSVVLTSATIAEANGFAFLREMLGVDEAQELIAPSPFDYRTQARLFIAPPSLNPKAEHFAKLAAPIVEECLERTRGRAFLLFTSYARLREIYALLRDRIPYPMKMQGDLPRSQLLEWFRTTKGAVLFATGTFWEGIDVVGDALSCVVIDRLPFPSPSDPLVEARVRAIEARGRSGFEDYMIPLAITRLKQGFGRLIRSKTDRGIVAILDGRALGMRYGRTIVDALPPAKRIDDLREIDDLFPAP